MIYHITKQAGWESAVAAGVYHPEEFERENFIHCSLAHQLAAVGDRYYRGQTGLVVLCIEPLKLEAKVVYENTVGGTELFPHIYGLLNLAAVVRVAPFPPELDGSFRLPEKIN